VNLAGARKLLPLGPLEWCWKDLFAVIHCDKFGIPESYIEQLEHSKTLGPDQLFLV